MSFVQLNILVVDDDAGSRAFLKDAVTELGHTCRTAGDGLEALEMHERDPADVIVSDWQMPGMDGLELCRRTRVSDRDGRYTHFLLVTNFADKQHFLRGMEAGADDYQIKPVDLQEFEARLASAARVVAVHRRLAEVNSALRRESQASFRTARCDALTSVGNRLRLDEDTAQVWAQVERYGRPCSALMCDIDWFKKYNDHFGHIAGDGVLRAVAETIRAELRQGDGVYRYGGEEFVVMLPEQSALAAYSVAERIRRAVEQRSIHTVAGSGVVTISIGVAELVRSVDNGPAGWLGRADAALYRAKAAGRNRCEVDVPSQLEAIRVA